MAKRIRRSEAPNDHLTRLANRMVEALRDLGPEVRDVKVVLMLSTETGGGMVLDGYERGAETEAMVDAMSHLVPIGAKPDVP
jgi:hypothetical protein